MVIYRAGEMISISTAIFGYAVLLYFQSFDLMRITLAAVLILAFAKYMIDDKLWKFIILVLLTSTIHYSSCLVLLTVIFFEIYKKLNYGVYFMNIVSILGCGLIIVLFYGLNGILPNIPIVSRYAAYISGITFSGIGILQFVYWIPIFIVLFIVEKRYYGDLPKLCWTFSAFTYSGFIIGILSYSVPMIGRAFVHFIFPMLILVPFYKKQIVDELGRYKRTFLLSFLIKIAILLYFWFRFYCYVDQQIFMDGIMPYEAMIGGTKIW